MATAYSKTPTVGTRIAPHLELQSILGEGGSATVFEAYHDRLCASVAVKIAMLQGQYGPAVAQRLVREARICARLDDPHFPRVYDIATLEDGRPYYVMEKVTGPTLEHYMDGRALGAHEAARVTAELLVALHVAHSAGIVHRDVKPGNVILQTRDDAIVGIRLMDFGIAHITDAPRPEHSRVGRLTMQGELLGTPGYMPPEQVRGEAVDRRSDIFAVGMVLYEMLLGRCPIDTADLTSALRATIAGNLPDPRIHLEGVPSALVAWIERATQYDPQDRFQSAREALAALPEPAPVPHEDPNVPDIETEPLHTNPPPRLDARDAQEGPRRKRKPSPSRTKLWVVALVAAVTSLGVQLVLQPPGVPSERGLDGLTPEERARIQAARAAAARRTAASPATGAEATTLPPTSAPQAEGRQGASGQAPLVVEERAIPSTDAGSPEGGAAEEGSRVGERATRPTETEPRRTERRAAGRASVQRRRRPVEQPAPVRPPTTGGEPEQLDDRRPPPDPAGATRVGDREVEDLQEPPTPQEIPDNPYGE